MTKTFKILSTISFIAMAIVLTFVGVWALTDLDFSVGGDITYTAPVPETKDKSEYPMLIFTITDSTNKTMCVYGNSSNKPTGDLIIPTKVLSGGVEYTITSIQLYMDTNDDGPILPSVRRGIFDSCSELKSVTIPKTVTALGAYLETSIFDNCSQLSQINVCAITPPSINAIGGLLLDCSSSLVIYVPTASVDAYKSAEGWSDYADKIQGKDFK